MANQSQPHCKPSFVLVNSEDIRDLLDKSDSDNHRNYGAEVSQSGSIDMFEGLDEMELDQSPNFVSTEEDVLPVVHTKSTKDDEGSMDIYLPSDQESSSTVSLSSDSEAEIKTLASLPQRGKRPKSEVWSHFVTITKGKQITSNTCIQCNNEVSPKAARMRFHLQKCTKVKKINKQQGQALAPVSHQDGAPASSVLSQNNFTIDKFLAKVTPKKQKELDMQLGRFLFSTDLAFNVVQSQELKKFFKLLNPAYIIPSNVTVGSTILDAVAAEVKVEMSTHLKGEKVCILQDGWSTISNAPVISHCLTTANKSFFLQAEETGVEQKSAEFCYKLLAKAIQTAEEKYGCKVVGVVTDNCSTMQNLHKLCKERLPELFVYGCNSHLLNLLGKFFTPEETKTNVSLVQNFMRNHHYTQAALRKVGAKRPVLPGTTRWNSQIDSFVNYCENHTKYLEVARQYKVNTSQEREKLKTVLDILNDSKFYESVESIIKILKPISSALDKLQGNQPTLADAAQCWLSLRKNLPGTVIEDAYYKKQEQLGMTELAIASYILHPKYKGAGLDDKLRNIGMNVIGTKDSWDVIVPGELHNKTSEYFITAFLKKEVMDHMDPLAWWKASTTSEISDTLKDLVSSLFVLPTSTGSIERNFSTLGNIMTKQRNRLSVEKASDLCLVHNFLKLKQQEAGEIREPMKRKIINTKASEETPASHLCAPGSSSSSIV